jgi:DNA-binding NarL/FixJ family response regulator
MLSILIVEDGPFLRKMIGETLRMYLPNTSIRYASDGDEALRKIGARVPDVILMDVRLPGRNGFELTREIKSRHPDVVVVIFTHYDFPEYRVAAGECGADWFLVKDTLSGYEIAELIQRIAPYGSSN